MAKLPSEILADIAASIEPAAALVELIAKLNAFVREESWALLRLRLGAVTLAASYAQEFEAQGYDRELADRAIAGELLRSAAFIVAGLKRRSGEPFSPGRFALVAYDLAEIVASTFVDDAIAPDAQSFKDAEAALEDVVGRMEKVLGGGAS